MLVHMVFVRSATKGEVFLREINYTIFGKLVENKHNGMSNRVFSIYKYVLFSRKISNVHNTLRRNIPSYLDNITIENFSSVFFFYANNANKKR